MYQEKQYQITVTPLDLDVVDLDKLIEQLVQTKEKFCVFERCMDKKRYQIVSFKDLEWYISKDGEDGLEGLKAYKESISFQEPIKAFDLPIGLMGYIGYESIKHGKEAYGYSKNFPQCVMGLFQYNLLKDCTKDEMHLITLTTDSNQTCKESIQSFLDFINHLSRKCSRSDKCFKKVQLSPTESQEVFEEKVKVLQEYIEAGDIFQGVLSIAYTFKTDQSLGLLYKKLKKDDTAPYTYLMRLEGEIEILGVSPETLVQKKERQVKTMPIAGTRPIGKNLIEQKIYQEELIKDEKEKAEHHMLLDLARNDLGKVCDFGSIKINKYLEIKCLPTVMHLASEVSGRLAPAYDEIDLIRSVLPAGTLSGAPKLRAMELIEELEGRERGIYGGGIGIIGFDQTMDLCIGIRSFFKKGARGYLQGGAGIVYDSIPTKEYEEVQNKLKALSHLISKEEAYDPNHR